MGDDSDRGKVIATLYLALAKAYKDNTDVINLKSRVEKEENHKINDEKHPLYSHKEDKILSFSKKVIELNEMYEDLMFDLADNSNESIKDIKEFSAEEVMKFNKRVVEKIRRKNKTK